MAISEISAKIGFRVQKHVKISFKFELSLKYQYDFMDESIKIKMAFPKDMDFCQQNGI